MSPYFSAAVWESLHHALVAFRRDAESVMDVTKCDGEKVVVEVVGWNEGFADGVEVGMEVVGWSEAFGDGVEVGLEVVGGCEGTGDGRGNGMGVRVGLAVRGHTGLLKAAA